MGLASWLKGSTRKAELKFFTDSRSMGRKYFDPIELSSADYALFDLTSATSPVNLNYCFTMPDDQEVFMGKN